MGHPRYKILLEIAKELGSTLAPQEVLRSIVERARESAGAKGCSLLLLDTERKQLIHKCACGLSEWYMRKGPVRADAFMQEALQGRPVMVCDVSQDGRVQYPAEARREGIACMLSVPVMARQEVIGVLRLYTSEHCEFSPEDIEFFTGIASLGALVLEKAERYEALGNDLERVKVERAKLEEERQRFLGFLTTAAHDLKAPLGAIQSYFEVLLAGITGELNEKQTTLIQRCSIRVSSLLELISDLLDIPRIEAGQIVQEMGEVSIAEVVGTCVEEFRETVERKGLKLIVDMPSSLPTIAGSAGRIRQVLTNLLSNAINYTDNGSITISAVEGDGEIRIAVSDTGIGVPAADLPRLFGDFCRGSNARGQGTGLGLSIARRIVEAHGGRIWVESPCPDSNTGTRFTFVLPRRAPQGRIKEEPAP